MNYQKSKLSNVKTKNNINFHLFQITLQLKLMSAAIFSVILLRRRLSALHWLALFALFAGVSIVQVTSAKHKHHTAAVGQQIPMLGFGLTVIGCLTSGFSGVYLEKVWFLHFP